MLPLLPCLFPFVNSVSWSPGDIFAHQSALLPELQAGWQICRGGFVIQKGPLVSLLIVPMCRLWLFLSCLKKSLKSEESPLHTKKSTAKTVVPYQATGKGLLQLNAFRFGCHPHHNHRGDKGQNRGRQPCGKSPYAGNIANKQRCNKPT